MSPRFEVAVLCVCMVLIDMAMCAPADTTQDENNKKCQPNLCDLVRCMNPTSCSNGATLVPPSEPCQCCTRCIKYKGNPISEFHRNLFIRLLL